MPVPCACRSWRPQGKGLGLFWRENVVPDHIDDGPEDGDDQKRDKGGPVVDHLENAEYDRHPPNQIVRDHDEPVDGARRGRCRISRLFAEPCEPHGCMLLNDHSVEHPDYHDPDEASQLRRQGRGQGDDGINERRNPQSQRKPIVPTYGQEFLFVHNSILSATRFRDHDAPNGYRVGSSGTTVMTTFPFLCPWSTYL